MSNVDAFAQRSVWSIGSLFSGLGGLELGTALALAELGHAHRIAWQVEADPFCVEVLSKHWPDVPRHRDVRAVRFDRLERVDIMCGGFPCQDVSQAGRKAGITGARSGLWSEYVRAVRDLRPRLVFVENVRGLLPHLGAVLGPLAELGYDAEWTLLRASEVGAPHERARLFLLAYARDQGPPAGRGTDAAEEGADALPFACGQLAYAAREGREGGDHLLEGGRRRPCDGRQEGRGEVAHPGDHRRERSAPIDGAQRALAGERGNDPDRRDQDVPHPTASRYEPAGRQAGGVRRRGEALARHDRDVGRRDPQSELRRSPHGLPAGLDRSPEWPARPDEPPRLNEPPRATRAPIHDRGERLHALGNAVVPQQACAAFLELYARIQEPATP